MEETAPQDRPQRPTGPPDFIGVGTRGSGWEAWAAQLFAHPGVARPSTGSIALHAWDRRWNGSVDAEDIARYHAAFPREPGERCGEWTPDYLSFFWVPPLLRRAAPDALLLVMLRDPVSRFEATLSANARVRAARASANTTFESGLYALQLEWLWQQTPRSRVLVLQFEVCRNDPEAQWHRTLSFLGLASDASSAPVLTAGGSEGAANRRVLTAEQRNVLERRYAPENHRLAELLPELDLSLWSRPSQ